MDEAARAQEVWSQFAGRTFEMMTVWAEANQRMLKEWVEFTSGATKEGLRLYPFFKAPAWADYALALRGLGKRDEAMGAAERALEIDPGLGRARVLLTELQYFVQSPSVS